MISKWWRYQKDEDIKRMKISKWWRYQNDEDIKMMKISKRWRYQKVEDTKMMKISKGWRYQNADRRCYKQPCTLPMSHDAHQKRIRVTYMTYMIQSTLFGGTIFTLLTPAASIRSSNGSFRLNIYSDHSVNNWQAIRLDDHWGGNLVLRSFS